MIIGCLFYSNLHLEFKKRTQPFYYNTLECSKKLITNSLSKAKLRSPFINVNLLNQMKKRKRLYNILKRRPHDLHFSSYFNIYCSNVKMKLNVQQIFFILINLKVVKVMFPTMEAY